MRNKRFKLFQCCIPVKGIKNGVVLDLQRKAIHKVPNQIIDLIAEYSEKDLYTLFNDFSSSKKTLKKYVNYFLQNELLIVADQIDQYPDISTDFSKPARVDVVNIEVDSFQDFHQNFFSNEIDQLGVNSIKIILKDNEIENLIKITNLLEISKLRIIVVFLKYDEEKITALKSIASDNARISQIVFHDYNNNVNTKITDEKFYFETLPLNKIFENKSIESPSDFVLDIETYHEALNHNLMFNKSIFIDALGNIKRHLEDDEILGNINQNKTTDIIKNEAFSSFWNITKDQVKICQDCEFRYICPDGRIPQKSSSEQFNYNFNTSCNYDPYQGTWKN